MDQSLKILLIEDSPIFVELTRSMLAEATSINYELDCVDNLAAGIKRLAKAGIDAVLLDLTLPDSNGLDTFLRLQKAAGETPTVIYTSVDDEDLSLSALNHGAADYLVKSEVNANWLAKSLLYAVQRSLPTKLGEASSKPDEGQDRQAVSNVPSPDEESAWMAKVHEKRLVTVNGLEQLKASLTSLMRRPDCKEVGIDMADVDYISNAAISMLLTFHKRATAAGKRLVLRELKPQVHEQFSSRRFDKLFDLRRAE